MYVQVKNGYFICAEEENLKLELELQEDLKSSEICFVNCGGTIVSKPVYYQIGVSPKSVLTELSVYPIAYVDQCLKLSENTTFLDYINIKKKLEELTLKKYKSFIVCGGTDYISTFGVYLDLLAKKLNISICLICSQRSLDKPTQDLTSLVELLLNNKKLFQHQNCLIYSRTLAGIIKVYSPYQIRKYDTFDKDCFYGENELIVDLTTSYSQIKKLKTKFLKSKEPKILNLETIKEIKVELETFFYKCKEKDSLKIGSGIGNLSTLTQERIFSRVLKGPLNRNIYYKSQKLNNEDNILNREITSWESYLAFNSFL